MLIRRCRFYLPTFEIYHKVLQHIWISVNRFYLVTLHSVEAGHQLLFTWKYRFYLLALEFCFHKSSLRYNWMRGYWFYLLGLSSISAGHELLLIRRLRFYMETICNSSLTYWDEWMQILSADFDISIELWTGDQLLSSRSFFHQDINCYECEDTDFISYHQSPLPVNPSFQSKYYLSDFIFF